MNFAMMVDGCAQRSYFVKDKKGEICIGGDNVSCGAV